MRWACLVVLLLAGCNDEEGAMRRPTPRRRSSGTSSSSGQVVQGTGASLEELCWSTINEYRKRDGLSPYARWAGAEACADTQAKDDAATGRGHGAFSRCGELAQNECPGTPGPLREGLLDCLAAMWDEGPGGGHHDTMASTKYKEVACGFFETQTGDIWSVQDFR